LYLLQHLVLGFKQLEEQTLSHTVDDNETTLGVFTS